LQEGACAGPRSRWYGPERPKYLGPLPAEYPPWLTGEAPADYGFDPLALSREPAALERNFELELLHARWAMLGLLGALVPEALQQAGAARFVETRWWAVGGAKLGGEDLNYLGVPGLRIAGGQGILIIAFCQVLPPGAMRLLPCLVVATLTLTLPMGKLCVRGSLQQHATTDACLRTAHQGMRRACMQPAGDYLDTQLWRLSVRRLVCQLAAHARAAPAAGRAARRMAVCMAGRLTRARRAATQVLLMFGPEYARACGQDALEPLGIALPDKNYPGAPLAACVACATQGRVAFACGYKCVCRGNLQHY